VAPTRHSWVRAGRSAGAACWRGGPKTASVRAPALGPFSKQATAPARPSHPLRVGSADFGSFFTIYANFDGVWLAPAWLESREVIAVFNDRADPKPSYIMRLEWRDGRISFIRDYRHVRYVAADAELALAPDAKPAGDGAAH
jgi:hypothetical protein